MSNMPIAAHSECTAYLGDDGATCNGKVTGWAYGDLDDGRDRVLVTACPEHMDEGTTGMAASLGLLVGEALAIAAADAKGGA